MANPDNWEQDTKITIRLPQTLKQRIWDEAKAADIAPSAFIREKLSRGQLPEDFIANLSEKHRERIEKWARHGDKSIEDIVSGLLPQSLSYYLDNTG